MTEVQRFNASDTTISCSFSGPGGTDGLTMLYWGLGNQAVGDIALNLDLSGQTAFELNIAAPGHSDSMDVDFIIELETFGGDLSSFSKTVLISPPMSETISFAFADFSAGVTWTDVDKIMLKTDASISDPGGFVSVDFNNFEAVPEPMMLGLFGFGGSVLIALRRRFEK